MNIRELIRRGAPANGDEAREIIRAAFEGVSSKAEDLAQRLSSALTEILVGRHLQTETYQARANALAVIDEISKQRRAAGC